MINEKHIATSDLLSLRENLRRKIKTLEGRKIIVVGDIGLDEYVLGDVRRISPEAPVPVLEVHTQDARLGLAANVAQNVASLGGTPWLVSVIGQDRSGEELSELLRNAQVSPDYLIIDPQRPTTRKLRVMAEHHHIVRVDYEMKKYLRPEVEKAVLKKMSELVALCDGIVIEDYAKGVLSEELTQGIIALGHKHGKKVLVDPNRSTPLSFYAGADLMTPNRDEAVLLSGLDFDEMRAREGFILDVGRQLLERAKSQHIIITRGKEGMSLFDARQVVHLPTYARQVFDVTGAGDTVIAALSLAWAAGLSLEEACVLANFAAGVVVGKVGCVPCKVDELIAYMDEHPPA